MKELSFHILDILENSIEAGAKNVELFISEDKKMDLLTIKITDDGKGIEKEILEKIGQPFITTKTEKSSGLGLYLLKSEAERCSGKLNINSEKGKGTAVTATFKYSSQYRKQLGNIADCLAAFLSESDNIELRYIHVTGDKEYLFDTKLIRKKLKLRKIERSKILGNLKEFVSDRK